MQSLRVTACILKFPMKTDAAGASALPGVNVHSFSKSYGRGRYRKTALRGVDFSATAGEVTGILGLNGAGKSTLLKAVCGIHCPTEGHVEVCGQKEADCIRRITAYVPELPVLDTRLTVRETLFFSALLHGIPENRCDSAALSAAVRCGVQNVLPSKISVLSKGYVQRTALAAALASDCPVLVLDEATAGLDPAQAVQIRGLLKELARTKCVIFSTHRIEEAEALCGKICILSGGRLAAAGTPADLLQQSGCSTLEAAFLSITGSKSGLEEEA